MPFAPHATRTPTDPEGKRTYGHQILHLTDRLAGAETYDQATETTEQVLDEADGVLARLGQFFEDAAATLSDLSDELHGASSEMRALGPPPEPHWQTQIARYYATAPQRPGPASPTSAVPGPPASPLCPEHAPQPRHHR